MKIHHDESVDRGKNNQGKKGLGLWGRTVFEFQNQ
jgi:hypothetical protein